MIKGKRIGDFNVKVTGPMKTSQKEVGVPLGKFYIPEKTKFQQTKAIQPCENEEDVDYEPSKTTTQEEYQFKTTQFTEQKISKVKNSQKRTINEREKNQNEGQKNKQTKNKSLEKYLNKKQNKIFNSFSKKELKSLSTHARQLPKKKGVKQKEKVKPPVVPTQTKRITSEDNQAKIDCSEKEKIVQILQKNMEDLDFINQQELQEVQQQERKQVPDPIKNELSVEQLVITEISFRNKDFEGQLEIPALSSQEEDDSSFQQSRGIQSLHCVTQPEQSHQAPYFSLDLKQELFSLSAEELLSKQYFNI